MGTLNEKTGALLKKWGLQVNNYLALVSWFAVLLTITQIDETTQALPLVPIFPYPY